MKILGGVQAWENLITRNRFARWDTAAGDADFELTARARLQGTAFVAEYGTDLRMKAGDKVFCIGSCFARNVEAALRKSGITVESGMVHGGALVTPDTFNVYSTASMLNELRWGLDPTFAFNEHTFLEQADGFSDPHTALTGVRTLERCRLLRNDIITTTRRLKECQFLILTLGLVEAWFDTANATYLNVRPPRSMVMADPQRFELHQLDYNDNYRGLEAIVELLQRHGRHDVQMVLTVSPVPFVATFSDADVVVANTYSKSVLRSVAQDFSVNHANVRYIPVYDSIMNTDPALAWDPDRIHVDADVVRLNITNFLAKILDDPAQRTAAKAAHHEARERLRLRKEGAAVASAADVSMAAPTAPATRADLPAFDLEDAHPSAFPQGQPAIQASSCLSEEFSPRSLMCGEAVPWHAQHDAAFPQAIDVTFAGPVRCVRLWLQSQDRYPERAPTVFGLTAGAGGKVHERSPLFTHHWASGGEWVSVPIEFHASWPSFQLVIFQNDCPQVLTLQRLWLEPDTWEPRSAVQANTPQRPGPAPTTGEDSAGKRRPAAASLCATTE
jgi:hypothetical protein